MDEGLKIDLYNASSSIKQIAPLLLYLRYRAAPNQTLIIDEPEMNLHPEGQAKLLEALGMLVNLGVRVLPGAWRRARIQGLLLTPYNAHVNHKRIEEARKEGVEILPLQYHHQAELRRAGDPDAARVSLSATTKDAVLRFTEAAAECRAEVKGHLARSDLSCAALRVIDA